MRTLLLLLAGIVFSLVGGDTTYAQGLSQSLPPLFARTPKHLVSATKIAEFPFNTFLENLVVAPNGNLFITSYEDGKIYQVTPEGQKHVFAQVPGQVAGIALGESGQFIVSGATKSGKPAVFRVNDRGKVSLLTRIEGALFLNGVVRQSPKYVLIADSYRGAIWRVNVQTGQSTIWLENAAFARNNRKNPTPGINGLKIFGTELYATNTQNHTIFRIPLLKTGQAGQPRLFASGINGDDFAFDAKGNLLVTTHIYNNVVRVSSTGQMTIIADGTSGVTGDTSLAFGRTARDRTSVYVVTNGGMSLPPPGGVQPAKVVRLSLGVPGAW